MTASPTPLRNLVLVLGDQLDPDAAAFDGFDPAQDAVWMAEVAGESTHVWSSKPRIAIFLTAMRHFAEALRAAGLAVHYVRVDDPDNRGTLADELDAAVARLSPRGLVLTEPGERCGAQACPFTTLYWDFLLRHEVRLAANPRTVLQTRNLKRLTAEERRRIGKTADAVRKRNDV